MYAWVLQVGWFLHTPFPSSEMYRTLPVREELLRAVLKADLIGFHTYDYARHFVSACTRILGLEVQYTRYRVSVKYRVCHSCACHMDGPFESRLGLYGCTWLIMAGAQVSPGKGMPACPRANPAPDLYQPSRGGSCSAAATPPPSDYQQRIP